MKDINEIPAIERLKPLLKSLNEEMTILDAEKQLHEANIKTLLKEIDLAVLEL